MTRMITIVTKYAQCSLCLQNLQQNSKDPMQLYCNNCRGHGFKSRTGLKFFQVLFTTTRFSSVLSCEDLLISSSYTATIIRFKLCEHCCVIPSTSSRDHYSTIFTSPSANNCQVEEGVGGGGVFDKMRCCVGGKVLQSNLVLSTELIT